MVSNSESLYRNSASNRQRGPAWPTATEDASSQSTPTLLRCLPAQHTRVQDAGRVESTLACGVGREVLGGTGEGQPAGFCAADAVFRGDLAAEIRYKAEDGVVDTFVVGRRPDDVHMQVADREVP